MTYTDRCWVPKSRWLWFLTLFLTPFLLRAQLNLANVSGSASLTTCGNGAYRVSIAKPGGFVVGDQLSLDLGLPSGVELGSYYLSTAGVIATAVGSTPQHPLLSITAIPSGTGSIEVEYQVKAACSRFSPNTSPALSNSLSVALNSGTPQVLASTGYNVTSAWVVFDPALSRYLNYGTAPFLTPFTRTYVFRNTSPVPFSGDFVWQDTVEYDQPLAAIRIDSAYIAHPSATVLSSFHNDSTAEIRARITSLAQGDSIVIREVVRMVGCPNTLNRSSAFMTFTYGCQGDPAPCIATPVPNFQTWALVVGSTAVTMEELNSAGTTGTIDWLCPANAEQRTIRIINTGSSASDTLHLELERNAYNNISYFKPSEVVAYRMVGGSPVYLPKVNQTFENLWVTSHYVTNDSGSPQRYTFQVVGPFPPHDTVYLGYLEHKACIDSAQYRFNEGVRMNYINEIAEFGHPCRPSGRVTLTWSNRGVWGFPEQTFGLQQVFENHTAFLNDAQEVWMDIDNKTPLTLNVNHPYFPGEVLVNPDGLSFQIELSLETGLGLIDKQIFLVSNQNGVDSIWYPDTVMVFLSGTDTAQGSRIVAEFDLPSYFFTSNPSGAYTYWGAQWRKTPSYERFFNRFAVRFKVGADCRFTNPGSLASISQRSFLIYDEACAPQCRFPLSEVGDIISIHCPGCRVPGWNLDALSLRRINFGYRDDDNDNHPDALVAGQPAAYATAPPAKDKRMMIGDTLRMTVGGFTSDGEVLLFNNIGFDYRYAWFKMRGDLFGKVDFIGGTGHLNGATFSIPGNRERNVVGQGMYIDLSLDTLAATLTSGSLPTRFWAGHTIGLELDFVVTANMTANGNFNLNDIVAFVEMSGVPRASTIGDAGPTESLILGLSPAQRAQYFYWCTGGEGRITGIGVDFRHRVYSEAYTGIWGVTGLDFCYKKLRSETWTDLGENHSSNFWEHDGSNQTALNSFSYEVRDFAQIDSIDYSLPAGWEVSHVEVRISNLMRDSVTNLTRYISSPAWYPPFVIPSSMVRMSGSTATIFPHQYYQYISDPAVYMANSGMNQLDRGDETKRIMMDLILKMSDCQTTPASVDMSGAYPVRTYMRNVPGTGDTAIVQNMPASTVIRRPNAQLQAQILPANLNTSVSNLSWQVNLLNPTVPGAWYDNTWASHTFVYAYSPSGNIQITNVKWPESSAYYLGLPRVDTIAGNTLYGLGDLWMGDPRRLVMEGNYSCADVESVDSVYVIYGWNCYGYPASIEDACFRDTAVAYIYPTVAGLQDSLFGPSVVAPCDTAEYTLRLNATGIGNLYHVAATLLPPSNGAWSYVPGSTIAYFGGAAIPMEPSSSLSWNLDNIPAIANGFNSGAGDIVIRFKVRLGCAYAQEPISVQMQGQTYCGRNIAFIRNLSPASLDLPPLPTDGISISGLQCSQTGSLSFDLHMPATTVQNNSVTVILPAGYAFTGGGSTQTLLIPAGTPAGTQTLSYGFAANAQPACPSSHRITVELRKGSILQCSADAQPCERQDLAQTLTCDFNVAAPVISLTHDGSCVAGCTRLIPSISGGSGQHSFTWTETGSSAVLSTDSIGVLCPTLDSVSYTLTVQDANGCSSSASYTLARCCYPPVLHCADTTVGNTPGICGFNGLQVPLVESECAIASLTNDWPGGPLPIGTTSIVWTAVNEFGDTSTCTAVVTVEDNEAPDANCQNLTVQLDAAGHASITASAVDNGSTDNCGIQSITLDQTAFDCSDFGTNTVTLTVTDVHGNSSNCTAVVTVEDNEAPDAICQNLTVQLDAAGHASITASAVDNGSTDNCGIQSITLDQTAFDCSDFGTNTVTLTVTDVHGNSSNCTAVVTVEDQIGPAISCPANVSYTCIANIPPAIPTAATAIDNCPVNISVTETNNGGGGCSTSPYVMIRTFVVTDPAGNSATCTQTITVATQASTGGTCQGCDASMSVYWDCNNPNCVTVTACKNLSNVVLMDCNGSRYKFDNLNQGQSGTFCHPSGLPITTVWVKAGCFQSGDGPGYGRRFNAPCDYCPASSAKLADDQSIAGPATAPQLHHWPNPVSGTLNVSFQLPQGGEATLELLNMNGQQVALLHHGEVEGAQSYQLTHPATDLPGGVYMLRLKSGQHTLSRRIVVLGQ